MKLRKIITVLALRTTVRFAWGMARVASVVGKTLSAVDQQAIKLRVDIEGALEPLVAPYCADAV